MTETSTAGFPPEVAPVRPGEEQPWEAIQAYLAPRLDVDGPMAVLQFPNGSANLTYLLSFGDRRFVLRRPPFGVIAPGAHDMRREYRVLSQLWQAYDRAPRAFLFCEDHSVAGSDFVVSEYRSGTVVWGAVPPELDSPDAGRRLGLATVDALADLHLVDPAACGLERLGRAEGFLQRQVDGWRSRWALVADEAHDEVMTRLGERLAAAIPVSATAAIVHMDYKMDNCQFTPGRPDRVTSVFDWDMATLADPLVDLGILLNYWPDPADQPDDRSLHVAGMERMGLPTRAEVVERYSQRTGIDVGDSAWYQAFACWRAGITLQQLYARYLRGETTDERQGTYGKDIAMLAARALRLLGGRP